MLETLHSCIRRSQRWNGVVCDVGLVMQDTTLDGILRC